jgi:autotransporter-associated beta strand protein
VASGAFLDLLGVAVGSEAITLSGGTLQDVTSSLAGNITLTADSTISATNANDVLTLSGNISGNFAITKAGLGTVIFTGTNAYTGGTSINAGTLSLGTANPWGASGTISFGGGTLQYSSSNTTDYSARFSSAANQAYNIDTNGQNVTFASDLTSSGGTLSKAGSGTLTLSGNNTYSGTTTVSAGTLAITSATGLGDTAGGTTVASGATLDLRGVTVGAETITVNGGTLSVSTGSSSLSGAITLSADSFVYVSASSDLTLAGAISGNAGFTLSGGGTLSLDVANQFTGTAVIIDSLLIVRDAAALGSTSGGTVVNGASAELLLSPGMTVSGENLTLNGSYLSTQAGLGSSWSGNISLTDDSTISTSGSLEVSGVISSTSTYGFTKTGSNTLILSNANTYTGTTTISAGTLTV